MAEFKSHFRELTFYVKEKPFKFNGGRFVTSDKETIAVLERISDVQRVDEQVTEETPKPKASAKSTSDK
jgi:hypothetical protein